MKTTMSGIGEKNFLRTLLPTLQASPNFVNGFGHDASIIDLGLEELLAFKIDRAPYPVALKQGIGNYKTWGRLAVIANISDLLAVGAKPSAFMLSIVVPGNFHADNVSAIIEGCAEACKDHQISFLGGDTKEGAAPQVVGSALGTVSKEKYFGRHTAQCGDYLFIAGTLGGFAGAVALLESNNLEEKIAISCADKLINPTARIKEGAYLRESLGVVAACDLSDGLSEAISIFCSKEVGISIQETDLPLDPLARAAAEKRKVSSWKLAFGVGDWSIACVVRSDDVSSFKAGINSELALYEIGQFNDSGHVEIIDRWGKTQKIPDLVNEHFRKRAEDGKDYSDTLIGNSK
ncbi:thiamine-phosphate kinase [Pseudomonas oryzihabitans]|uniref:thiamine-phosphate kinase n=1 Tax=Pseudomonas oryzihabitans TaxID=47885 RepID=UPI001120ACF6|nr:thiamine-phosphate kinase [Pseudomonas psychrotolerans]QDD90197.1 hypothetical protein CCZ28_14695 [Pseudomonas psychrotolerans]